MTPRKEALAFRIWQYANPLGWDVTAGDIAEALGTTPQRVGIVCRVKGWGTRIRRDTPGHGSAIDFTTRHGLTGEVERFIDKGVAAQRTNCAHLAEEAPE